MPTPAHLSRLVSHLSSDPAYATGTKTVLIPVTPPEAAAIATALATEMDEGTTERDRLAAEQGLKIHCHPGCNACCSIAVMIYKPEAQAIADWLQQPEQAATLARFQAAYPTWAAAAGDLPQRLTQLFVTQKQRDYDALHLTYWRKRLLCPFNHEGSCSIYPVRPLACRNAHALDTDAHCRPDPPQGKPAAAVQFLPLSEFMRTATRLLRATHNASSPPKQRHAQQVIPAAVAALLPKP